MSADIISALIGMFFCGLCVCMAADEIVRRRPWAWSAFLAILNGTVSVAFAYTACPA